MSHSMVRNLPERRIVTKKTGTLPKSGIGAHGKKRLHKGLKTSSRVFALILFIVAMLTAMGTTSDMLLLRESVKLALWALAFGGASALLWRWANR